MAETFPTTGGPDFSAQPETNAASPGYDQAEGTTRLLMGGGSLSRSGRIVWATGFEGNALGNGGFTDISSGGFFTSVVQGVSAGSLFMSAWQGNKMAFLQTQAVNNDKSNLQKFYSGSSQSGRWGLEAMIEFGDSNGVFNSTFDITFQKRMPPAIANTITATIRFVFGATRANFKIYYLNSAGVYVQLADVSNLFSTSSDVYYFTKLVVDMQTGKYVRFILNQTVYDLSGIDMQQTAPVTTAERSTFIYELTSNDALTQKGAFIDNIILTADEP